MSGFEPHYAWEICIGLALLGAAAVAVSGLYLRKWLRPAEVVLLLALRLLVLLFLLGLLLQPFRETRHPNPDQFQVLVLADASASMKSRDCGDGRARLAVLQEALAVDHRPASWLDRFNRTYRSRVYLFSEELIRYDGQPFDALPGRTALGDALRGAMEQPLSPPVGAVLVLSDGNGNCGTAVEDIALNLQTQGIPVSCVGIGELGDRADAAVRFLAEHVSGVKGQPLTLRVGVRSSQNRTSTADLILQVEHQEIARRAIVLPGHDRELTVDFSYTPSQAGFQTAAVELRQAQPDANPANDVDYAAVQVVEPPKFHVLYLGASLNWEYKFCQLAIAASDQIVLAAVIQTGIGTFYTTGLPSEDKAKPGFPRSLAELTSFDSIVLETRAVPLMREEVVATIADFVAGRGGGLLCIGPLDPLPPSLRKLLPVTPVEAKAIKAKAALEVNPALVFDRDQSGVVTAPPGLYLPPAEPVWLGFQLKKSARPVIWLAEDAARPVMAAQAYGSGRVAYCGIENSWRWRMSNQPGLERHTAYWQALLSWLSSASKPRLTAPCHGRKVELGAPLDLALDVTAAGFLPATDASVEATVIAPNGSRSTVTLQPTGEKAGRYSDRVTPEEPGEYRVTYRVTMPGETLAYEARFLARSAGGEQQNTLFQEKRLRDIARITGGEYWGWRDLANVAQIPVSDKIPYTVEHRRWTESVFFLVGLIAALMADWYARRRLGLK